MPKFVLFMIAIYVVIKIIKHAFNAFRSRRSILIDAHHNHKNNLDYFVADEIKKLSDMHSAGVLTKDEFQCQKGKLLGLAVSQ